VLDVEHRRTAPQLSFGSVEVDLLLETRNPEHAQAVARALGAGGYHADPIFERRSRVRTFAADELK
jgi:threonine dehydratase